MPELTKGEARILANSVASFSEAFRREVADVLQIQFRGAQPAEIQEVLEQLSLLSKQLGGKTPRVHDAFNPLLKRIVVDERRRMAEAIDLPLQKAIDPQLVKHLNREVRPLEDMMNAPWFEQTTILALPRLTDYLSIRFAEEALGEAKEPAPRVFDEKFHILEAPALFLPDLAHYRKKCAYRGAAIAAAYVDIDDFKTFNTRYTETVVDLKILAPFMELLEAHTFALGHAYRFGGDEYVILLPNMSERWAVEFLRELSARVAAKEFVGVDARLTLSAGLCPVEPDCMLTDREILGRANVAKNHVKTKQRGRIASYRGTRFREEDLVLL